MVWATPDRMGQSKKSTGEVERTAGPRGCGPDGEPTPAGGKSRTVKRKNLKKRRGTVRVHPIKIRAGALGKGWKGKIHSPLPKGSMEGN